MSIRKNPDEFKSYFPYLLVEAVGKQPVISEFFQRASMLSQLERIPVYSPCGDGDQKLPLTAFPTEQ